MYVSFLGNHDLFFSLRDFHLIFRIVFPPFSMIVALFSSFLLCFSFHLKVFLFLVDSLTSLTTHTHTTAQKPLNFRPTNESCCSFAGCLMCPLEFPARARPLPTTPQLSKKTPQIKESSKRRRLGNSACEYFKCEVSRENFLRVHN